jgi:hypothetical protein
MNSTIIERLHRVLGLGMDSRAVAELASNHIETKDRRNGLTARGHAEFLLNNLVLRFRTPPSSDLGAHFFPALGLTILGIVIYLLGGRGPDPGTSPRWPLVPLALGLIWLIVQTSRVHGFPTRGAVGPAVLTGCAALADAFVMPVVVPEDYGIRVGLVILALAGPTVFLRFRAKSRYILSWPEVRNILATDNALRLAWNLLSVGLVLIALADGFALSRYHLPDSLRIGSLVSGVGLAWLAQSFHRAGQTQCPRPGPGH